MTALRSFTRRFRLSLSRTLWRWTKPLRKPPAPVAKVNARIDAARARHAARSHLIAERREIIHAMLRGNP